MYQEIEGDLIRLALHGKFDVIAHGCNCFCKMGAGIAPQMAKAFGCDSYPLEDRVYAGDINKLGTINCGLFNTFTREVVGSGQTFNLIVVNAYTQFKYGRNHSDGADKPVDYEAIIMCMRKMNHIFKGKHIGLPKIGAGLAGGDWDIIKNIIQTELKDCEITVVVYKP
jgi:O-acetyl-ADP-ribose deacetylase (regulator of RNase III)